MEFFPVPELAANFLAILTNRSPSHLRQSVIKSPDGVDVVIGDGSHAFGFENHDFPAAGILFGSHWHLSVYISAVYLFAIWIGQWVMRNREPLKLKRPLVLWNIGLALFSGLGFSRLLMDFVNQWAILGKEAGGGLGTGVVRSICSTDHSSVVSFYWCFVFMLSKVPELGDTAFIVLRKGKLIFLHWYHHITVMMYCWYDYSFLDPCAKWFTLMNFFVHAVMYSYFALRAMNLKVPRPFAMSITVLQILQMFAGLFLNLYTFYLIKEGADCRRHNWSAYTGLSMYLSYLLLFINFFLKAYCLKPGKGKDKAKYV